MTTTTPSSPENPRPKVSVCVVTYNQEKYIAQCLQSLVDQETDFPFEIIVGDDCSTDSTRAIVSDFATQYPNIIRPVLREKNIGPAKNYIDVHSLARGDYVAHVDGDDYALPGKLAAQVALLNSFPEVALSVHAVEVVGQKRCIGSSVDLPEWGDMRALLKLGTYFVNSSTMYRAINAFDHEGVVDIIDYCSHIEQASRGTIHLNKNCLGAYRWHADGVSKSEAYRSKIELAYGAAFDRAIELGASLADVKAGRLIRHKSFAISRLVAGDKNGFFRLISLGGGDWFYATWTHRVIFLLKWFFATKYGVAFVKRHIMA
ncbi:MAG: glycosyltransferase family 2 protein [Leptothrix ochracea]|uniref:glycosyltransferase family 2 protein n=1 Tax=Leptothrix ochracea TaxID=735331 RepID=UPI0034E27643